MTKRYSDKENIKKMFMHTVFKNDFKMLIDKSSHEIEQEFSNLYHLAETMG